MSNIIEIDGLIKKFGDLKAVDNLSFRVKEGELFAFLGVNGAGKSTTINIMSGQLAKDAGNVKICGIDLDREANYIKRKLGVVFQNSVLDAPLTVKENLKSRAALYGINGKAFEKRLEELAETLDFKNLLKRPVGKLSGGQRRRIDIARALLHKPSVLILDEPTTGLDPQTRKVLWKVINDLRSDERMTVFLTTHYMEEAADADYVVILDNGLIVAEGTPLSLKNEYSCDFITVYNTHEEEALKLSDLCGSRCEKLRDGYRISVQNTEKATELILNHPYMFKDFEITKGKMDDVFLAVTGKKLTGGGER